MGKIEKKKTKNKSNKKNNGRAGGTNCPPTSRHASSSPGPVRSQIFDEFGTKGAPKAPLHVVLNLAAGSRSSRVTIVCRWSCNQIGGAMYVVYADDAFDSIIADVHSRGSSNLFAGVVLEFSKPRRFLCLSRVSPIPPPFGLVYIVNSMIVIPPPLQCYAASVSAK